MSDNKLMRRTDANTEQEIVRLIALRERYADISKKTGVAVPTIKKIKKRSQERILHIEVRVTEKLADDISTTLKQTYRLINRLLDKDEEGLIDLSVKDLLLISNEMHRQTTINSPQGPHRQKLQTVYKKYL